MNRPMYSCLLIACLGSYGCSTLTTKEIDKPVVIKSMKQTKAFWSTDQYETVLLTPERRQVLIKYGKPDIICSEAPSDSGLKIDTLINSSVEATTPEKTSGKLDFNNQSNTTNIALHNKTQSIKYLTEASHVACNMYMNGVMNKGQYEEYMKKLLEATFSMLVLELPHFYDTLNKKNGKDNIADSDDNTTDSKSTATKKDSESAASADSISFSNDQLNGLIKFTNALFSLAN